MRERECNASEITTNRPGHASPARPPVRDTSPLDDIELGDGDEIDLDDPDVGYRLQMLNPNS